MVQQRPLRSRGLTPRLLPYRNRGPLLSRGELFFYLALRRAVAGGVIITFKVRLADLVTCNDAGIPLLRVRAAGRYDSRELAAMIDEAIVKRRLPSRS